ncbi:MAG TPA: L-ribulose-5-phosphate 4-epimerase AraD [Acidimicrobiales bacterium]|nr:L-ribulose-5-phosphate 4-epimerase AraD [Acidimicrobiales bacterium]
MLEGLREEVLAANLALPRHGLVTLTWGNVSGIDRERGLVVIKPSGLAYEVMGTEDLVVVDLDGRVVEGDRRPSTDTPTHVRLYRAFPALGGVVHTHSTWATAFAQAEREIPVLGTTHADLCPGPVPVARHLRDDEVAGEYEASTGSILVEAVGDRGTDEVPGALAPGHGPFAWGADPAEAVERAVTLEEVARMALLTLVLRPDAGPLAPSVRDKHYQRKHGPGAYYGQAS